MRARPLTTLRDEGGAGSVLALGLVGVVVTAMLAAVGLGGALAVRQRAIGAADAAALAAADTQSGLYAGDPCAIARTVAAANRSVVTACEIDGLVVTVAVTARAGPVPVAARSTAGPPP